MSYITYKNNDVVYIDGIGYGTLINCGKFKALSVKQPDSLQRNQSIHFDPDMFNSDGDSNKSKKNEKSPPKIQEQEKPKEKPNDQVKETSQQKPTIEKEVEKPLNIVTVKLLGTQTLVYASDQIIRKYVVIPVKAMLPKSIMTFNVKIEINKTIESLKRQIFEELGLKIAYYYNIKLFITSPWLTQLGVPSKTISEYRISENSKLVITGEHAFCFENVPEALKQIFITANNNMTLISQQKPKPLPLPASENKDEIPVENNKQGEQTNKKEQKQPNDGQNSQNKPKDQQPKPQSADKQNKGESVSQKQAEVSEKQAQSKDNGQATGSDNSKQINEKGVSQQKQGPKQGQKQKVVGEQQNQMKPVQQNKIQGTQPVNKIEEIQNFSYFYGDESYVAGRKYWEIKLDKLPKIEKHLQIGISINTKIYVFFPLLAQKCVFESQNREAPVNPIESKKYGTICKQGENLGVMIQFGKDKHFNVSFYRNNVGLGVCFSNLEGDLTPIFGLGSNGQLSLDSRVQCPLDSYRRR